MIYRSYRASPMLTKIASWASYSYGYLLIILVIFDWFRTEEFTTNRRWLIGATGVIIGIHTYAWRRKPEDRVRAALLVILLGLGASFTFQTIFGAILAWVCIILVTIATVKEMDRRFQ